ncbi:PA0069 family radical SAM protein [Sphingobacterium corticis]|uniref:PA0069 family radical SAM protein n=1 Tax=Sphingobacterium corticis TaxID=1812823 RepID=A0ABW5NJ23_9SPHI
MNQIIKGRGAQCNPHNRFSSNEYATYHSEGIDCWEQDTLKTTTTTVHPKTLVNTVASPDVGMLYSANPYQGCEHGCVYCYARNSHEYWGYNAGSDFESKILVKENAPQLFEAHILKRSWDASTISLSGNTDCYQPLERKYQLTRRILEIAECYGQPISIITKNSLVRRDIDILQSLAKRNLCVVYLSINSLSEETRLKLEPRTATARERLRTLATLTEAGIPTGIMCAPIIPGLTDHEISDVLSAAADHGAKNAGYTIVRLNGQIADIFTDWVRKAYPDRADKILHSIASCHDGRLNNSNFGERMAGSGHVAQIIKQQFLLYTTKYGLNKEPVVLSKAHFKSKNSMNQLRLF